MPQASFSAIAASPHWHRAARKRRSKARARRLAGTATRRDQLLLALHHGTPGHRTARLMGKGRQWGNSWQGYGSGSDYWQQQPWKPTKQDQEPGKPKKDALSLQYNQVVLVDEEDDKTTKTTSAPSTTTSTLTQQLQKVLNASRKASAKLQKLQNDQRLGHRKWKTFEGQLKALYNKQKAQYEADMSRMDKEIAQAAQAAEEMEARLKATILAEENMATSVAAKMELDEEDHWATLMKADSEPEDAVVADHLHQAMLAAKDVQAKAQARLMQLQEAQHAQLAKIEKQGGAAGALNLHQAPGLGLTTYGPMSHVSPVTMDPYHVEGVARWMGNASPMTGKEGDVPFTPPRKPTAIAEKTPLSDKKKSTPRPAPYPSGNGTANNRDRMKTGRRPPVVHLDDDDDDEDEETVAALAGGLGNME